MKSVFIADSQKAVAELLHRHIDDSADYRVAGRAASSIEAQSALAETSVDIVICEMGFDDGPASELIAKLSLRDESTRYLVFSDDRDPESIKAALEAGAHGFVEKSVDLEMVSNALGIVAEGGCFFGFNTTEALRSAVSKPERTVNGSVGLTQRESEVLTLIAEGNSNKEIAARLKLSVKTIDNHRCSLMKKLNLHNVAAITRYAVENRFIEVSIKAGV